MTTTTATPTASPYLSSTTTAIICHLKLYFQNLTFQVILTVEVTDGDNVDTTTVDIAISDVNDRNPVRT